MSKRDLPLPPLLGRLSTFIDSHIEHLAGSSSELRSTALHTTKHIFDWALETEKSSKPHLRTLLTTLTQAAPPQTRSQTRSTSTRRRSLSPVEKPRRKIDLRETPLPSLFIEGMNTDQIWQQLDLRAARICENLQSLLGEEDEGESANVDGEDSDNVGSGDEEEEDEDEDEDDAEEMDIDGDAGVLEELSNEEEDGSSTAEDVVNLHDEISDSDDDENYGPPTSMLDVVHGQKPSPSGPYAQGHSDLDDGFFDLATFNIETIEIEAKKVHKRKLNFVEDEDSTEESEIDLFGSVDESITEDNLELFYNDFFDLPPGAQSRNIRTSKVRFHERVSVKKIKSVGKGMPVSYKDEEDSDEEDEGE